VSSGSSLNKRVLADGAFDPIHLGHVRYLAAAKCHGQTLIVHIAPDAAILAKGRKPFQTRIERAMTVQSLAMVDAVRCYESLAVAVWSECPWVLVKGEEWRGKLPEDVLRACRETEAEIIYVPTREKSSTERLHDCRSV
jgi:cytidyltransferase-like protein